MKPIPTDIAQPKTAPGTYLVNEMFWSIQGEGLLAGTPMLFVRLSRCNLRCRRDNAAGFDCDTDFTGGREMTADEIVAEIEERSQGKAEWILLTGGEPTLQVDAALMEALAPYKVALESNGTVLLTSSFRQKFDHITVSPKSAIHTIMLRDPDELRIVLHNGQAAPVWEKELNPGHVFVSPAASADLTIPPENIAWCIEVAKERGWRLSVQQHKLWGVR